MSDAIGQRRAGDDAAALRLFQEAYGLNKTPKALTQIALAEQALGRWSAADKHLRQALESGADPWIKKNRLVIDRSLDIIATHVGQLDLSGKPAGAEVRVDGELVGALPLPHSITVTAGGVAIEVSARGYLPIVRSATISAHTLTREIFNLQSMAPVADPGTVPQSPSSSGSTDAVAVGVPRSKDDAGGVATPPAATQPSGAGSTRLPLVLAAGGLSVASLAFGIVEHLSWQNKVTSFGSTDGCGTTLPDKGVPGCQALYDDGQHAKIRAFVGYGLAAAFAATAIVLHLTDPSRDSEPPRVACAPDWMTTGVGCAFAF